MDQLRLQWYFLSTIVKQDLKRLMKDFPRLLSALIRPLLWLWVLGYGIAASTKIPGVSDYQAFLIPGLLSLSLLFACITGAMSLVMDQHAGFQQMIATAPVPRSWVILTYCVSTSITGLIQAGLLLLVVLPAGYIEHPIDKVESLFILFLIASLCTSIGLVIATSMRHFQGFATIMNFLIFPMFFLSGSLYPITHMPTAIKMLIYINPFAHGVNLMHQYFGYEETMMAHPKISWIYMGLVIVISLISAIRLYSKRFD